MFARRALTAAICCLVAAAAVFAGSEPVAVSPGHTSRLVLIADACPTFSWGQVDGARGYELLVYRLGEEGEEAQPVLRQSFKGAVSGWTPALAQCLDRGGRYAWSVRAVRGEEASDWSQLSFFQVALGPSVVEFAEAVAVVQRYLAVRDRAVGEVPVGEVPAASEGRTAPGPESPRAAAAASPEPRAPVTQLSVEGGVEALLFTGNGSGLTSVTASDLVGANCVSESELDFDPATQSEMNTHSASASAHHVPTVDTTCHGAACDGTAFTNVTAASGDSATGFFTTGRVAEQRIDDAIARDAEVTAALVPGSSDIVTLLLCANKNRGGWRYWDLGDGTVLDCNTGLRWLNDASCAGLAGTDVNGKGDWATAQAAAAALADGTCGLTDGSSAGDWRQPTISELCSSWSGGVLVPCPASAASDSLIDSSLGPPTVVNARGDAVCSAGDPFVGVQSSVYWSATENVNPSYAWAVALSDGDVTAPSKTTVPFYVWPVRGGQ